MSRLDDTVVPLRLRMPLAPTQGTLALDLQPRHDPPAPTSHPGSGARGGIQQWAQRFAQAAVEIVGGDRPVTQLVRWTSRDVYEDLQHRARVVARAGGFTPGQSRVQPVRPRVRSVHTAHVSDAVVEACMHVRYGSRSRAVAGRFERRDGRWICTALEFA